MPFDISTLRQAEGAAVYVAPQRICVTADGELCDESDPRAVKLLVGKGGSISAAEAAAYGLIGTGEPAPDGGTDAAVDAPEPEEVKPKKRK